MPLINASTCIKNKSKIILICGGGGRYLISEDFNCNRQLTIRLNMIFIIYSKLLCLYSHGQIRSGHLNSLLYIINKPFFTLLSITMRWISLWIKNFEVYIYTKLPSILCHNSYFAYKQKNIRESRKET